MPKLLKHPYSGYKYYFRQYIGAIIALIATLMLMFGYDRGYMDNSHLVYLSLGITLIALFIHETRPFKVNSTIIINYILINNLEIRKYKRRIRREA